MGNLSPEETTLLTVLPSIPPDLTPKSTVKKAKDSHGHPHGSTPALLTRQQYVDEGKANTPMDGEQEA